MNLQMDPLDNPLGTRRVQTGREMSMEPYPKRQCWLIDEPDRQSGSGSVPSRTRTRSDGPDLLLTLPTILSSWVSVATAGLRMPVFVGKFQLPAGGLVFGLDRIPPSGGGI